jgi:chaperonin GroES
MGLVPMGKRILIEPEEAQTTTDSGIIIPDTATEAPRRGKVISISADLQHAVQLQPGDVVMYGMYAGAKLRDNFTDYIVLEIGDVLAKVV